jgi:hypothetical protein
MLCSPLASETGNLAFLSIFASGRTDRQVLVSGAYQVLQVVVGSLTFSGVIRTP